jgi:thiol-disulfide isomerase/thioredoxin
MFCWTSNSAAGDGTFFSYSDILVPMNSFSRMESHFELQFRFMHSRILIVLCFLTVSVSGAALARQQAPTSQTTPPAKSPATQQKKPAAAAAPSAQASPKPKSAPAPVEPQDAAASPDAELQATVQQAGNDRAALIRNLEAYLAKYPDSPRRVAIYRGLLESEIQLQNQKLALDYAEKIIAIQPEDSQTLFLAATLLEKMPDDVSQVRAMGYDTHLIELVGKADPESRSPQMTLEDWQAGRNKFTMNLYVLRGKIERRLHKNDEAVKDLSEGFRLLPNVGAALNLGEIAEERKNADEAVRQYAVAFLLAGQDPDENTVSREELRLEMGNLWRRTHDSNVGLGDVLLTSYDKARALAKADSPEAPVYNKGVSDPLQFSLRRVDGTAAMKLADMRGKTVILDFWTTWCSYCRITEELLSNVRKKFAGRDDVVFVAVNNDEEQARVGLFLKEQKVEGTLVFADGLDSALKVESIPTIIVLDRAGKVAYRTQGFAPDNFVDALSAAITKASGPGQ